MSSFYAQTQITQKSGTQKITYFPDRGCVHTVLPFYVYATAFISLMQLFCYQQLQLAHENAFRLLF